MKIQLKSYMDHVDMWQNVDEDGNVEVLMSLPHIITS